MSKSRRAATWAVAIAVCLVASWLVPPFAAVWDWIDASVFRALNGSLAWGMSWQLFWAMANCRGFDAIAGSLIVGLFACFLRSSHIQHRLALVLSFGVTTAMALVWQLAIGQLFIEQLLAYERPSPTAVYENANRLSLLFPEWKPKDYSPWSFPSDHGYVLATLVGFFWFHGNRRFFWAALTIGVVLALPRLVSGAHWLSDVVVGSGAMTLTFVAIFFLTSAHDHLVWRLVSLLRSGAWPLRIARVSGILTVMGLLFGTKR